MTQVLQAKKRLLLGKGPARRLRMNEELPAVVYSFGQETLPIIVSPREASKMLRGPLRRNVVINLEIADDNKKTRSVMIKERQIHPIRRELTHIDFIEVDLKKPVTVSVPVKLVGKSEAVVLGGKLDHVLQKIKINCLPTAVPEQIDVDISPLLFGSTHCQDIPLPAGISLTEKPRVVVLTIKKPRGAAKEEEGAAAAGGKPAAKAAAKPAAAAAAPKAKK